MLLSRDDRTADPAEDAPAATVNDPAEIPARPFTVVPADGRRARVAGAVVAAVVVAAAVAAGWWSRAPLLDDSLWWDEVFSAHVYVRGGPAAITDPDLYIANNHLLYTIWTWFAVGWFGMTSFAVRFFGMVPAVLAAVVATGWSWRRLGPGVGATVAVLFATSPLHVEVSTLGRGWGLAMLSVVWMLVASVELARLGRAAEDGEAAEDGGAVRVGRIWTHLAGYGLAGIVGTFTIAPMAIPFVLHALPLLRWRALRWRVVGLGLVVGTASAAWYAEVLDFVVGRTNNVGTNLGTPIDGLSWAVEGWRRLLRAQLAPFADVAPPAAEVAVAVAVAALVAVALVAWWRAGGVPRLLAVHLPVGYLGSFLAMWAFGANAVDRYVSFLLGHVLLLVAGGAIVVVRWVARQLADGAGAPAGVATAAALLAAATALPAVALVDHRAATTAAPYEAAEEAAALVRAAEPDVVITNRTVGFVVFRHYLGDTFEIIPATNIGRRLCRETQYWPEHTIAFLDYPHPEWAPSGDVGCLVLRDTTRTVLTQRRTERGITVWISRPRQP